MKYYVINAAFGPGNGRAIETEEDIQDLLAGSTDGLIKLKNGDFIGVELLKNSYIQHRSDKEESVKIGFI